MEGLRKADVELICNQYGIHYLIMEDILSMHQRPKMDEVDNIMYCLLNMLYYNDETHTVEQEQISIVLGKEFVVSFQEELTYLSKASQPLRDIAQTILDTGLRPEEVPQRHPGAAEAGRELEEGR